MRRLRILLELIIACSIAAWGGADVYLSGGKFTWPPPPQLMSAALWSSAEAEYGKLTHPAPRPAQPMASGPAAPPLTETASAAPAENTAPSPAAQTPSPPSLPVSSDPPPAPAPAPAPVAAPACPENPGIHAVAFPEGQGASYCAPGHLAAGSGQGVTDTQIWSPDMRFPVDAAPAYANSQVWGIGGTSSSTPGGSQADARNYAYPWSDDFCENRAYATQICPSGTGHQGQDIRPAHCCEHQYHDKFRVDAAEDGTVTSIGTYTVYFTADSGRLYRYLHMDMKALPGLGIAEGAHLKRGQQIGWLSDNFGNAVTTFHLHFEIKQAITDAGGNTSYTWVSPYPSLIVAYGKLLGGADKPALP